MKKEKDSVRWGLRAKLNVAFAITLLVPSLLIGIFSYQTARTKVENQLTEAAKQNVQLLNHTINQMLEAKKQEVEFLAGYLQADAIQSANDPAVRKILTKFQETQPMLERTYIGTEAGVFIKWPMTQMKKGFDPRQRPWYKDAVSSPEETIVTSPYIAASSKNMVVTIARMTRDGKGVVGMDVSLKKLADITKQVQVGKSGYAFITDKDGNVIVHPEYQAGERIKDASWFQPMLQTAAGEYEALIEGEQKKVTYVSNAETGWKIGGAMLKRETDDAARPILYTMLVVVPLTTVIGVVLVYFLVSSMTAPLKKLMMGAHKIKEGDLRTQMNVKSRDEFGQLGHSFNQMNESLRNIVAHMNDTAEHLAASSEQLSASSDQTKSASGRIASIVHRVVAEYRSQEKRVAATSNTVKEMATAVQHIAVRAETVSDSAVRASQLSGEGKHAIETVSEKMSAIHGTVRQLDEKMEMLGERSREIGTIVAFINEISEQTNLLSLNAAIEAARAGDQGRGFAVVADEVRKLANQTGEASHRIEQEIHRIQREIEGMVNAMKQGASEVEGGIHTVTAAGESFLDIDRAVQEVTGQIQEISASTEQIAASTEEVVAAMNHIAKRTTENNQSLESISKATDEQLSSMEEIAASSHSLANLAEEMQQQLRRFTL
ncbi:methyl-accepting chemotaxis protein [Aneurinibacillus danicus]|jgi:methyl-accepting chemotaxis protein|uniref:Methyl-accepting chemotaxis protein n=1 Tax=Aneurinibacillus danicus TaxID=267746 RepID=A0A511V6X2_9BACL|nr:methyl-accepting chemotaxis protein [Aneurinibacillus danicus]GEN34650.1 methyl-accepting chemotaxis protein [Aneurinibacillus danicus]